MSADLPKPGEWLRTMMSVNNAESLEAAMLSAFHIQYAHNRIYQKFCNLLRKTPASVTTVADIPYLPVSFFKTDIVNTGAESPSKFFRSSGTTGAFTSRHYFHDLSLYEASFFNGFEMFYGPVSGYCILGLLPSYLEQEHSSLVYMVKRLMEKSGNPLNGFFLHDHAELSERLERLESRNQRTLLIGVTYALVDFSEQFPLPLHSTIVMETGGMKGRRKEMIRAEVHNILKKAFHVSAIHSEYGMTELFSQAYAKEGGLFRTPPWMKVTMRDEDDPFGEERGSGVLYIADLANIYSCCFIATEDQGKTHTDGSFEVTGRIDNSDIRGCSLMYGVS